MATESGAFNITEYHAKGAITVVFPTEPVARTMDVPAFPGMRIGPTFGGILLGAIDSLNSEVEIAGGQGVIDNRTTEPVRIGEIEIPAGYSARTLIGRNTDEVRRVVSTAVDRATSLRVGAGKQPAVIRRGA